MSVISNIKKELFNALKIPASSGSLESPLEKSAELNFNLISSFSNNSSIHNICLLDIALFDSSNLRSMLPLTYISTSEDVGKDNIFIDPTSPGDVSK